MIDITRFAPAMRFVIWNLTLFMMLDFSLIGYDLQMMGDLNKIAF